MNAPARRFLLALAALMLVALGCRALSNLNPRPIPTPTAPPTLTPLPPIPVVPGIENPSEPVFVSGTIRYTFPFFEDTLAEPFVLLEDQAGMIRRDEEFVFQPAGQVLGAVEAFPEEDRLTYTLALPAVPQGTLVDVDNDGKQDTGVQVFAVAYWTNTWGGPFLEPRDGTGWSAAYTSTINDPELDYEIQGGTLIVWAPDDEQAFPTGFGPDGLLFTEDDPTAPISPGYNLVDLNTEPFRFYKEARPTIDLIEGEIGVHDLSELSYPEAFEAFFEQASREYPFTAEKKIDWEALRAEFGPLFERVNDQESFFRTFQEFAYRIPDGHVGLFDQDVFFEDYGGGLGLVLAELSDGKVIAASVLSGLPADRAGIRPGAEIIEWDGSPVAEAIEQVIPGLRPSSTGHHRRISQVAFLTRMPVRAEVTFTYRNPGASQVEQARLRSVLEVDSLIEALPALQEDPLGLPVEARILEPSGLGYIRINSFSDDDNLMARLWHRHMENLIELEVPGLILDVQVNGGGNPGLARDFAGYFFDREIELYQGLYFNEISGEFKATTDVNSIQPGPLYYRGLLAVLIGPNCISACEGFAYALGQEGRSVLIGHYPTAGAFGEVGRGQYRLPGDISFQIPTGRPETPSGELLIEGTGVLPDIQVPVTVESATGQIDAVLDTAIQTLMNRLGR